MFICIFNRGNEESSLQPVGSSVFSVSESGRHENGLTGGYSDINKAHPGGGGGGSTISEDTPIEIHCIEHKAFEVQSCRILIQVLYITVLSNRSQTATANKPSVWGEGGGSETRRRESSWTVCLSRKKRRLMAQYKSWIHKSPWQCLSHLLLWFATDNSSCIIPIQVTRVFCLCCCCCFSNANVTEKAMAAVGGLELMSAEAPACRRAASAPSGCQSRRTSWRNPAPLPGFCLVGKCRDLTQRQKEVEREKETWFEGSTIKRSRQRWFKK